MQKGTLGALIFNIEQTVRGCNNHSVFCYSTLPSPSACTNIISSAVRSEKQASLAPSYSQQNSLEKVSHPKVAKVVRGQLKCSCHLSRRVVLSEVRTIPVHPRKKLTSNMRLLYPEVVSVSIPHCCPKNTL